MEHSTVNSSAQHLLAIASAVSHLDESEVLNAIANPEWTGADKIYDWRNHLPDDLRAEWPRLATESRLVAFVICERDARLEDWD